MGEMIGYARVSTYDQNLDLQIDALKAAGVRDDLIFSEHKSGKDTKRPALQDCMRFLRSGDTLVIWKLDRLGRSAMDLLNIMADLKERGVHFHSLNDRIDTDSPFGTLIFTVAAAFAQLERDLISDRTRAGMAAARARGKVIGGRQPALKPKQIKMLMKMKEDPEYTDDEVAEHFKISMSTFYRYVKDERAARAEKTLKAVA